VAALLFRRQPTGQMSVSIDYTDEDPADATGAICGLAETQIGEGCPTALITAICSFYDGTQHASASGAMVPDLAIGTAQLRSAGSCEGCGSCEGFGDGPK
jgi:hypothetical protein